MYVRLVRKGTHILYCFKGCVCQDTIELVFIIFKKMQCGTTKRKSYGLFDMGHRKHQFFQVIFSLFSVFEFQHLFIKQNIKCHPNQANEI